MVVVSFVFCMILLIILIISYFLRKQAIAYIKIGTFYTNKFFNKEISLEEYASINSDMKSRLSPLLKWYLKKEGVLQDD